MRTSISTFVRRVSRPDVTLSPSLSGTFRGTLAPVLAVNRVIDRDPQPLPYFGPLWPGLLSLPLINCFRHFTCQGER